MTLAQVKEFNETFGVAMSATPTTRVPAAGLRYELIREEFEEFGKAKEELDIVEIADALGDILYVVNGALLVFGLASTDPDLREPRYYKGIVSGVARAEILGDLHDAILWDDQKKVLSLLTDILFLVNQTAEFFGIDLEAVVNAIHKSNMSKLGEDGLPIYRELDRKVLKGPNYKTPTDDIRKIVFGDNYAPEGI